MDFVEALRYTLRTFGIPIDGPEEIFCDNKLAVMNLIVPTSNSKKIHNAICYHRVWETQASDIFWLGWIEVIRDLSDLKKDEDYNFYSFNRWCNLKDIQ